MQRRQRHRQNTGPLLVKEIILPGEEKPGPSLSCLKNVSGLRSDEAKKVKEKLNNATGSCLKIGGHEAKLRLKNLEMKVQEPYFKGTRQKKGSKKKTKHKRVKQSVNELLLEESQNKTKENEIQTPTEKSLSLEDIVERKKLQQRIRDYEKMKKHSDKKNQMKQRLAEQKYIEKYENLAETWWELLKRQKQLQQEGFTCLKPPCKEHHYNKKITISIISRKYWNSDEDTKSKKVEGKCKSKQEIEELREGILHKLVFVDDENSDELESSYHLRKKT